MGEGKGEKRVGRDVMEKAGKMAVYCFGFGESRSKERSRNEGQLTS